MKYGNVLVTGGAGFLGSQLLQRLVTKAKHVYVIDDLSTGNRASLPKAANLTFYEDSITNEKLLETVLPKVEWIFHLACRNLVLSAQDLRSDLDVNLLGGFLLLQKAKDYCPNLKRFVYTSTASVYGNASTIPTPESYYRITLPYSASKFSAEHYCQVFYHMYNLPVTILRFSNVYGPGQLSSNPYCGVIAKFFEAIMSGDPIIIYDDGTQTRDFTFVEDAIDAVIAASTHPTTVGKVYNIGTGTETRINQLADTVIQIMGYKAYPTRFLPGREVDKVYRRAVDPTALQTDIAWSARYSIQEGIAKTYHWLKGGGSV
ncbi:NAD-dependent epimerase/dehydratase family protein [Aneurinibacillus tyrosinisolvens]|uniref:NAD-dependent epimerase/dehydratase family protein n=1 Tax=Aneurinibacillus tyrosinisolvens TaxID=1443435 RepID=UPI00063F3731|nr:NAD-dependent epimerase/dehydratase family protein [Aneurinibacillus tyrosinisolvens]